MYIMLFLKNAKKRSLIKKFVIRFYFILKKPISRFFKKRNFLIFSRNRFFYLNLSNFVEAALITCAFRL